MILDALSYGPLWTAVVLVALIALLALGDRRHADVPPRDGALREQERAAARDLYPHSTFSDPNKRAAAVRKHPAA